VKWWQEGVLLLGGALLCLGIGMLLGGALEARRAASRTQAILDTVAAQTIAHAATVAALRSEMVARDTSLAKAEQRATAAEAGIAVTRKQHRAALAALSEASTALDSLATYPAVVDALSRELVAVDSARVGYRDALAASQARAGALLGRIAADSLLIERQRIALRRVSAPPPPSKSGWGCVAGVGAVTGLRSGLGVGVTCGRRLS
jgi:hypothetical protein